MNEELKYRIALTLIPGIGDVLGKKLIAYCGGPEAVFRQKKSALVRIPGIGNSYASAVLEQDVLDLAESEIRFMEREGIVPLFYLDENYPRRLKACPDSPMMLYYKGNTDLNKARILSVVGTREASIYGKDCCNSLIEDLSGHDVLIVSGMAYGIDICAHKACLKHQVPTVAVFAHGLDSIYPALHRNSSEKMLANGAWLSDYTSGTKPDKENFPRRNRIVAGMSDATIVIESGKEGGSMITAEIANSYNRDVFAYPGRCGDEFSAGCNKLIKKNKAALVESAVDVLEMMGWDDKPLKKRPLQTELLIELTPEEEKIVSSMTGKGNVHVDEISALTGITMRNISGILLKLEFSGRIVSLPGKMYRLT